MRNTGVAMLACQHLFTFLKHEVKLAESLPSLRNHLSNMIAIDILLMSIKESNDSDRFCS